MSCRGTPPSPQRQTCPEEILGITSLGPLKQPQPGPHQAGKQGLMFSLLPGSFCSAVGLSLVFPWPLFYASVSLCLPVSLFVPLPPGLFLARCPAQFLRLCFKDFISLLSVSTCLCFRRPIFCSCVFGPLQSLGLSAFASSDWGLFGLRLCESLDPSLSPSA